MSQEGAIVRNKTTGEMGRVVGGQVVPMQGGQSPANPVIAPPDPYKQAAEQRAREDQGFEAQRLGMEGRRLGIAEQEAAARAAKDAADAEERARRTQQVETGIEDAKFQMRRVIQAAGDAKRLSREGWFATGFGAEKAKTYGGTTAADVSALLKTIGANTAFDRLQKMRDESPTGGALGQVSEIELQLLRDSIASLDQAQSDEQFQANMDKVSEAYQRVLDRLEGTAPAGGEEPGGTGAQVDYWPGVVGEDGKPLPPDGGYGRDPETGEWHLYGRVSDDAPSPYDPGGPLNPVAAEAARMDELTGKMGAVGLAGHGISLGLSDEAAGIGKAIGGVLRGNLDIPGNYRLGRDAEQLRIDRAREESGWLGTAAEFAGGGALGRVGNALAMPLQAGRAVAARGAPVTRGALQGQMARQMGTEGAAAGAVGGFGYGRDEASIPNALIGAAAGGALGYGGQRIGNALANRAPAASRVAGAEVQQAADSLNIPVIPAVTGGTTARRLTAGARQGFVSDRPISGAVQRMDEAGGAARDRTAASTGRVLDNEDAGDVVRQAANVYSKRTAEIGGNLYRRADRRAGGEKLPLTSAVKAADDELAQLAKGPGGPESALYQDIAKLRAQMDGGSFEVDGIRAFRSRLRNELTERGLRGTPQDVAFSRILRAAEDDMISGLQAAGKEDAAGALRTAAAFWRKRVETIDEVLEPVIGKNAPRSGEQIVSAIERMANPKTGNASRLRKLFQAMPDDESRSVSATLISRMGQPTKGAAEKADDAGFSFNTFLTNWNNMSPRARSVMFPKETREALDKLATVARGVKQAGTAVNTSNTAGALGVQAAITAPLIWLVEPLTAVTLVAGQWTAGRLLASPRIARWIATAPKDPKARAAHIAKLGGIARAEPAIANEIGLLQRAANDNLSSAVPAAAEENNGQ